MPLDFPTSPAVNEIYTFGGRSWIWNGIAWDVYSTVSGTVVTTLNGLSGGVTLAAGSNITLSPVGNTITIASSGGGGGGATGATGATGPQGNTGATGPVGDYVISLRGLTGAVGLTNGSGIGLSVSGNTLTFSNTGVLSIDGSTGDITNVARTNVANTFTALQSFSSGISAAGGATFATDLSVNSVLVGRGAGSIVTNTVLGAAAFTSNISGTSNVAVGQQSLQSNTGGSSNTAIGRRALNALTVGSSNTSVGTSSLLAFNGNNTVSIGANSATSIVGGTGNVYVGANVSGTNAATREIVIGESAVGLGSNTTAIGRTDQTSATIYGLLNVPGGISAAGATLSSLTTIPSGATLSVLGNIRGNVVNSINGITGAVNLAAGSNITITPSGLTLTIASTGGGGGQAGLTATLDFSANINWIEFIASGLGNDFSMSFENIDQYTIESIYIECNSLIPGHITIVSTEKFYDSVLGWCLKIVGKAPYTGGPNITSEEVVNGGPVITAEFLLKDAAGANIVETWTLSSPLTLLHKQATYTTKGITGQSWVTADSFITCKVMGLTSDDHSAEDAIVEDVSFEINNITPGVGFDIMGYAPEGTYGKYTIKCLGE